MNTKNKFNLYFSQYKSLFGNEIYKKTINKSSDIKNRIQLIKDDDIIQYKNSICLCKKCNLEKTRKNFVFGSGNSNADLFFVGEAPGEEEDSIGEPFVGRAGKLLDKILKAINTNRSEVYITNVLKCRPPNNRDPLLSEVNQCEPYLINQISIIKPKIIVALGRVAGRTLLKIETSLNEMREKTYEYNGIPMRVTYHPSALLRNPNLKKAAWEDFQWIRDFLQI